MLYITPMQKVTLIFIHNYTIDNGFPPSVQEMADDRGIQVNAAQEHVYALVRRKFINKINGKARSITFTAKGDKYIESL